jgi:hypothetical protein
MPIEEIPANKRAWQSKTVILGLISAALPFFPGVHQWVAANPELYGSLTGIVFAALRLITNGKVTIL